VVMFEGSKSRAILVHNRVHQRFLKRRVGYLRG